MKSGQLEKCAQTLPPSVKKANTTNDTYLDIIISIFSIRHFQILLEAEAPRNKRGERPRPARRIIRSR